MVLLKAWHNAQISLALWAVVFGFTAQDTTVTINRVPAEIAAQCWAGT
jgi:hypothetical protein